MPDWLPVGAIRMPSQAWLLAFASVCLAVAQADAGREKFTKPETGEFANLLIKARKQVAMQAADRMLADAAKVAVLAIGFVLAGATDWELVVPSLPAADAPICAKSEAVCETARDAIRSGRLDLGVRPDVTTACVPHVDCFSYESDFIAGYNLPGTPRR